MKKLTLSLEELAVESFATGSARAGTGTVEGLEAATQDLACYTQRCKTILTQCPCTPML
jgi:hypothetical protein